MTMLDRMRRHKGWLKWSLFIVVIAFIWLYIPSFMGDTAGAGARDVVASVDGRDITVARFRRLYNQQMQAYRNAYGEKLDDRMLRQLGIEQRIVQQMVEEEIGMSEARRLGITATDTEVSTRIQSLPAFQENGQFIGFQRYQQILNMQNPPLRANEFEEQIRRGIVLEKLQAALTGWVTVSDKEVDDEFVKRNEKVKLGVVSFPADKFRDSVSASDEEVSAHFEGHKEGYRIPEKRKIRYVLVDTNALRERTAISAGDIQKFYQENEQQYTTPEQVTVSHILLKTEGKDDAAVKKQIEDIRAKAVAGEDFAQLANKFSEDEGSNKKGGVYDFFSRGTMVKEFEDSAFALKPGEISEPVKTQYGYHIIKGGEKRAATTRTLEEVRPQIEDQLKWERAREQAQKIATELTPILKKPEDFDKAKRDAVVVSESGFFGRGEPIAGLGVAPAAAQEAFSSNPNEVKGPIATPQGLAFITVTGTQEARLPSLDEVRARVREDVVKRKAVDAARQKATSLGSMQSGDLAAAAKAAGLEMKTTDLIARGAPIPEIGVSTEVDTAAFALPVGGVSQPITTDNGAVVVKVLEKKVVTPEEIATGRDALKNELLNAQRNRFYGSYMSRVRKRLQDEQRININAEVLTQMLGNN
jgi:peptidyl-prolyl cis-trans isomerase D